MATKLTAKEYIDSLSYEEFKKIRIASDNPDFMQFLIPNDDVVASATLSKKYADVGVPNELLGSPEAVHYLVIAISNRVNGNA